MRHTLTTYAQASLAAAPTDAGPALTVRLYGSDQQTLTAAAGRIRQALASVPGVVDPRVQSPSEQPAIQITANVVKAARYGLKPGDIRRQTSVLVSGIPVGSYYQQQQIFDVSVWSEPAVRQNLTDIQDLLLDTPGGGRVPLRKVAAVSIAPAPSEIDHDRVSRYLDITAAVRGASLGGVVSKVGQRLQTIPLPFTYHAEVFSALEQRQGADRRTLLYALAAAAGALLLLQAAFQSWRRAALLLLTLPLAGVGGLLAALLADRLLTVGALLGFITVFTIALRNGILLMRRLGRQEREHGDLAAADRVVRAAGETAFPVVLTAVALALVVLPFVARGAIAGLEVLRPLGLVVIGGLVTSTLYSLLVLPALYLRLVGGRGGSHPLKRREVRHEASSSAPADLALLLVVGLGLAGCAHAQDPAPVQPAQVQPAQIKLIPGSADLHRVTLTPEAVSDVGIRTAPVRAATTAKAGTPQGGARALTVTAATTAKAGTPRGGARALTVIPLTAVIYDPQGRSWTYVTPAPRTFVRAGDHDRPHGRRPGLSALRSARGHARRDGGRRRTAGRRIRSRRRVSPAPRSAMRAIVSWSLNFRFLVLGAAAAMMVFGAATISGSPVDVFPNFAPPQVEIQTESLGLSTTDVESLVTVPLELAMNGMPGLADVRSTSVPQLSSIVLVFKPGTDLLHARQLVQERLAHVRPTLPRWASPPVMLPPVSATGRVIQIGMSSSTYSAMELSRVAYWTVKARLLQVDGVADVSIWNERQPTFQVEVDPSKMAAHHITLDDVERTTSDALDSGALQFSTGAVVGAGGFVETGDQRLPVVHVMSIQSPRELAEVPLEDQPAGATRAPGRRGPGGRGPTSRSSATPSSTAGPGSCWSSRSCRGATRSR